MMPDARGFFFFIQSQPTIINCGIIKAGLYWVILLGVHIVACETPQIRGPLGRDITWVDIGWGVLTWEGTYAD
jgi:hypothetical protein